MTLIDKLHGVLGDKGLSTGDDMAAWSRDWTGQYTWTPMCVARPANTAEVSAVLAAAHEARVPVVPVSGNTGLNGGTKLPTARDALARTDEPDPRDPARRPPRHRRGRRGAVGDLHDAADAEGLKFPVTFGARGSARCWAECSPPMRAARTCCATATPARSASGWKRCCRGRGAGPDDGTAQGQFRLRPARPLVIGAEGTLGIITAAVLKLVPLPGAYATAVVGTETLDGALALLNRLQQVSGGAVEAFEYMCPTYMAEYHAMHPDQQRWLSEDAPVTLLVEVGATAPRDVTPDADGTVPIARYLEDALGDMLEEGAVLDAVVAQNDAQRQEMWAMREAAAEVSLSRKPLVNNDIAVSLDNVSVFLEQMDARLRDLDPDAKSITVAHLGDGNIHYTVWPSSGAPAHKDAIMEACEDVALGLRGSFSAEHGIGVTKLPSMARRKDAVAVEAMRAIKSALDPLNILNPGKVIPAGEDQ
jgi:FAD/FMN-containing dehydrogenase